MEQYKMQVPDGVEDCLPAECYIKKNIEDALRKQFALSGYDEVETPAYEYYDVFQSGVGAYMQESMIKFVDSGGRICVLRPDLTVPIARVAATKLPEGDKRLFYIQNSYAAALPAIGRAGEFTQAGIELIGDQSAYADAEVIALAIKTLRMAGLKDFAIDIGQVQYFKALVSHLRLADGELNTLRHAVDSKDAQAIDHVCQTLKIDGALQEKIRILPTLYGGGEVLSDALALSDSAECTQAVDNLRSVYGLLCDYGLSDYLSIDLGLLHDIAYYSGIVFRGLATGIGFPVVSGGRYDGLLAKFGRPEPATGFALGLKRVMIAMERQGLLGGCCTTDVVISCDAMSAGKAYSYAESQRAKGLRTVFNAQLSTEALLALKKKIKAESAVYFDADGVMQVL